MWGRGLASGGLSRAHGPWQGGELGNHPKSEIELLEQLVPGPMLKTSLHI